MKKLESLSGKLKITLQWVNDLESGEMIESRYYRRTYLFLSTINQKDLIFITKNINQTLAHVKSKRRVQWCLNGHIISYLTV